MDTNSFQNTHQQKKNLMSNANTSKIKQNKANRKLFIHITN